MSKKWFILSVIILMYLPVSIDATVLHVAAPQLGVALGATGSELLWIIDIYSLVMAGMLLPMGALGDKIGFKRLTMLGATIFGLASLAAALAPSVATLITARAALAIGAAMILPATLKALRQTFSDERERSFALGIWVAVGTGGAAMGPLIGGLLLEHFYWGSVFLINIPIILIVLLVTAILIPRQDYHREQTWTLSQALVLISGILLLVYAAKSGLRGSADWRITLLALLSGAGLLFWFVRHQLGSAKPMIDLRLLASRVIAVGALMAMTAMVALIGFELLLTQELQFVVGKTPLESGMFLLPLMIASGVCGPFAGWLLSRWGLKPVAAAGMALCSLSLMGLALTDFTTQSYLAWGWMILMGFSVQASLLSSTTAILSSAPPEKAGAAGSIEGMAYELGAGLGVTIFGLMLSGSYAAAIVLPSSLPAALADRAGASIGEAVQVAGMLGQDQGEALMAAARQAFTAAHSLVLASASVMLLVLAAVVWYIIPKRTAPLMVH